jgi:hypothetical protein
MAIAVAVANAMDPCAEEVRGPLRSGVAAPGGLGFERPSIAGQDSTRRSRETLECTKKPLLGNPRWPGFPIRPARAPQRVVGDEFQGNPEVLAHRRAAPTGDVVSLTGRGRRGSRAKPIDVHGRLESATRYPWRTVSNISHAVRRFGPPSPEVVPSHWFRCSGGTRRRRRRAPHIRRRQAPRG